MTTAAITPQATQGAAPDIFDTLAKGTGPTSPGSTPAPATGDIFDQLSKGTYKEPDTVPGAAKNTPDVGTIAVPSAGRIPGVMMPSPKVTPGQAAGGVAAGAVAGALPLTPEIVSAVADMAKAHPFAAGVIKKVLAAGATADAWKHRDWLMKILP